MTVPANRPLPAVVAAGLAGFACMAAELTAVRLLAPHFGDSAYVWTNVIGVILAAMAGGAVLGGRWSAGPDPRRSAAGLLGGAALLLAAAPFVAPAIGGWLLPASLPLDAAMPALVRGSFVATALLFAPPLLLLGAVSPLLVTSLAGNGVAVGRAVGWVGAAGTLGSLAGTFAATHWLVPGIGCRLTMLVAAAALLLAAATLAAGRQRAGSLGAALLVLGSGALLGSPLRPVGPGKRLLAEVESRCQFLQVQQDTDREGRERVQLVINEGLDSFHSLAIRGSAFTGAYYDWHAIAPLLAGDGSRPPGLRALSLGDAAGTLRAVYAAAHPGAVVDAVDIDAATMQLGEQFFPGPKAAGGAFVVDGRVFLERASERWHVIHVDAYAHQVYVPAHLASREFFAAARQRLLPGGVIACNVGALGADDPVLRAIGASLHAEFGNATALLVPASRNALLVARVGEPLRPTTLAAAAEERVGRHDADIEHWRGIVRTASEPSAWRAIDGGEPLADDRPRLDRLLQDSYLHVADAVAVTPCAGAEEPAGAEAAAFAARSRRDWDGVLAAVRSSRQPTAYLREQAGDARWGLRQLRSAVLEYEAARALGEGGAVRRLTQKLGTVQELLQPIEAAEQVARRNGWLEAGLAITMLAVFWFLRRSA